MQAIVLSRRDFKENDQIISLYTLEHGKVEALARGVKKILSKNAAHLEPFCVVEAEIIPGKKDWAHVGSVTSVNVFKSIRADLDKSIMAGYVVGLLNKIIRPHEPDKRIFNLLTSWLAWINDENYYLERSRGSALLVDAFIVKFFYLLGFDITADPNSGIFKKDLQIILRGDWPAIIAKESQLNIHLIIYRFAVYHSERKIDDWAKLENAS